MPLFRKRQPVDPLAVSMTGVKLGDRLLVIGTGDPPLIAMLAAKSGLTGTACAVDSDESSVEHARRAVEREGVLADVTRAPLSSLPYDADSFDVVVIRDVLPKLTPDERARCLQETRRVLRMGGRVMAIDNAPRAGVAVLISRRTMDERYVKTGGAKRALEAERFVAVRVLAEREGRIFVEGAKR
jgi:ubiquinone/menaquinone biosynthesis C-methylase UbiE